MSNWSLSITSERGIAPAEHFTTKRGLFGRIVALGELSRISKVRVAGGWHYVVSPKKKEAAKS